MRSFLTSGAEPGLSYALLLEAGVIEDAGGHDYPGLSKDLIYPILLCQRLDCRVTKI